VFFPQREERPSFTPIQYLAYINSMHQSFYWEVSSCSAIQETGYFKMSVKSLRSLCFVHDVTLRQVYLQTGLFTGKMKPKQGNQGLNTELKLWLRTSSMAYWQNWNAPSASSICYHPSHSVRMVTTSATAACLNSTAVLSAKDCSIRNRTQRWKTSPDKYIIHAATGDLGAHKC
jgi:hypothetical protein